MDRRTDGVGNAGLPIGPAEFSAAMGQAHPSPDMPRLRAYRLSVSAISCAAAISPAACCSIR